MIANTTTLTAINGQIPEMTVSTDRFSVPEATNRSSPNGGVIMPMQILRVTTRPKWMGSMPNDVATGNSVGTSTSRIEFGSMNIPATKKIALMTSRNITQFILCSPMNDTSTFCRSDSVMK